MSSGEQSWCRPVYFLPMRWHQSFYCYLLFLSRSGRAEYFVIFPVLERRRTVSGVGAERLRDRLFNYLRLLSIALRRSLFSPTHLDQLALGQKYQLPVVIITLASAAGPRARCLRVGEGSLKVTTGTGEQRARGVISDGAQGGK